MKDEKIKALTEKVGATRAPLFWAMFVERLCEGIEPEPGDTFKREDIERKFESNPTARDAFIAIFCAEQKEAPKGRKFKPGRSYSAAEYGAFYAKTPEDPNLVADIARATDGKRWVIAVAGKFCEAPSAQYIQWHMDEDFAPATIDVDGVPVAPVMPGDERVKETKEYPVDPHTPGGFLDVNNKSPRTGADFTGYTDEEIQATIMAYPKLQRMDDIALQRLTLENKGKGGAAIVKPFSEIAAVWARTKPADRAKTKAPKRPFVEPTASTTAPRGGVDVLARPKGWIPTLCFLGTTADRKAWEGLYEHLAPLEAVGALRITSDSHVPTGGSVRATIAANIAKADAVMCIVTPEAHRSDAREETLRFDGPKVPVLLGLIAGYDLTWGDIQPLPASGKAARDSEDRAQLAMEIVEYAAKLQPRRARPKYNYAMYERVYAAILSAGLASRRNSLIIGIDKQFVASIPTADILSAQVAQDLSNMDGVTLQDGSRPLLIYLSNALRFADGRAAESAVFREALAALGG